MGLITPVLCIISLVLLLMLWVRQLLRPIVPVKGKTNVPGLIGGMRWPILGDALWFAGVNDVKGLWDVMWRLAQMRKSIMSIAVGSKLMIWILDAKSMKAVSDSKKCQRKEEDVYRAFVNLTDGVFSTCDLTRWSYLRQELDKLLHSKKMADYMVIFANKAEIACNKVQRICGQGVFDVREITTFCFLDIVLEIFLGIPGTQQLEDTLNFPELFEKGIASAMVVPMKPHYKIDWIFQSSAAGRASKDVLDSLRPHLTKIVDECLQKMVDRGYTRNDPNFEPQNYLEAAVHFGFRANASREKTIFSFTDFMIAGSDTSSTVVASTIIYLAMHPEYQEKAYQEQLNLMGNSLEAPTMAELSRMEYLNMAYNETLRKIGPPAIIRNLSSQIEIDGNILPEGSSIWFWFHSIHNDTRYWERPQDFYPEHFLPEKVKNRPACSYMPFGFGSRGCPGRLFAQWSVKLILSMLLRRFKFTTPLQYEELTFKYMLMVEFEKGYPVEATPRVTAIK